LRAVSNRRHSSAGSGVGVEGRVGSIEAAVEELIYTVDLATLFSSATQHINMLLSM
jgi:hypothetical protein